MGDDRVSRLTLGPAPAYRPRPMRRRATAHASGRINLIGEHTDYNDGLVMPVALRLGVTVEAGSREDGIAHLTTDAPVFPREVSYQIGSERKDGTWADRVRGGASILV